MSAFVGARASWRRTRAEIIEGVDVRAVRGPLDLSFAADDSTPKLCIEPRHDFHGCVALRAILHLPVAVPTNYWPVFTLPHVEIPLPGD